MVTMKGEIVAIIPARGGSKGVPGKNLRDLAGKPLIAWTIEAALRSDCFASVVVSTDDPEIATVAQAWGASVPFMRPAELADDTTGGMEVVFHALEHLPQFRYVVLLQPTSPLRTADDIRDALKMCVAQGRPSCVSFVQASTHPHHCFSIDEGMIHPAIENSTTNTRRQDMPEYFALNGALYIADCSWLQANRSFVGPETLPYIMPPERSVDIDTLLDFEIAEILLRGQVRGAISQRGQG
jgi:CMP-N,N'-diacetyllegionaminic acid synthase